MKTILRSSLMHTTSLIAPLCAGNGAFEKPKLLWYGIFIWCCLYFILCLQQFVMAKTETAEAAWNDSNNFLWISEIFGSLSVRTFFSDFRDFKTILKIAPTTTKTHVNDRGNMQCGSIFKPFKTCLKITNHSCFQCWETEHFGKKT